MESSKQNRISGIYYSLSAGILWGIVPVYIYIIDVMDPYEIVAHRSIWSAALLFLICWIGGQLRDTWVMLATLRNFCNFFFDSWPFVAELGHLRLFGADRTGRCCGAWLFYLSIMHGDAGHYCSAGNA